MRKGELKEDLYECNDCRYERVLRAYVPSIWEHVKLGKRVALLEGKSGSGQEERENVEGVEIVVSHPKQH